VTQFRLSKRLSAPRVPDSILLEETRGNADEIEAHPLWSEMHAYQYQKPPSVRWNGAPLEASIQLDPGSTRGHVLVWKLEEA
jgi:hypothetical protein